MIGQMIGRYRVVRPLGEGGMARVFVAEDTNVGRQVAIKVLLPEYSNAPRVVERFMNEAKAMGRIRHPGVVDVFEVMVAPTGELCIIMELVVGETLREALWKHGPLPAPAALAVMEQLADTVAAAHAERIIHRDLKPENVILVVDPLEPQRPRVRVLDFGIAKVEDGSVKTATGTQMGTATYMAPEQFRNAKLVDHRADIYALGCVFFELATGTPPLTGRNLFEQMQAHLTQPPPLDRLPPTLPPYVRTMIGQMLEKERDRRTSSLGEVVATLRGGGGPAPVAATALTTGPAAAPGGSRGVVIALVAIVLVAAAVAAAIALS
ncbi:MAG: serine/threonine protein kinase [Myxococcales bacterium]|nr:serine/threonine protein kinase [Myxococcales bacterium]